MKVSLNWLTDYVDISIPAGELGDLLTHIGLNLEGIIETDTDIVLDLEVTSNRPDCLGHLGVAREIAAATGAQFRPPVIDELPVSGKVEDLATVEVSAPDLCPRYTARVIRGVKIGPSPSWMIERLEAVGLRSINNIVDATNYVLMEYSQPLHSFDYDKLSGQKIIVRRAKAGEMLISIDETHCRLDENMLVIADAEKAVAIAGVMGALNSEVGAGTINVLIESAQFDPLSTRHTSRKLQLMSESNYRFERGVDPVSVAAASLRACQLIIATAGGELAEGMLDVWAKPWTPRTVALRVKRCNMLLGIETPPERQKEILAALGLDAKDEGDGERIICTIPSHRGDLSREADLIEEVARMEGYDRIPVSGHVTHAVAPESLIQRTRRMIGEVMTAGGFDEAITSSFVDAEEAELFGWADFVSVDPNTRRTNNILRATVIPSLLRACKTNQDAGNSDVSLFELASAFSAGSVGELAAEDVQLATVTTGDLRTLRGAMEMVVVRVADGQNMVVRQCDMVGFCDGMAAEILIGEQTVGLMGIVGCDVVDYYGLNPDRPIAAGYLRFDAILERAGRVHAYQPVAKFPAVRRDLSVLVDEEVTWQELVDAIDQLIQPARVAIQYVTTYRGKQIPRDRKSVTLTLIYRDPNTTLRSEQVDQDVSAVLAVLKENFAAELRA